MSMDSGKHYWRSLDQLADTPAFREWLHREFPQGASELENASSRRTLLKMMAASVGLAGLTACSRPVEKILPHAKGVQDYVHGQPMYYATAMTLGGETSGLLVEVNDARPTKIEGNPEHPNSLGAASAFAQASVLSLYDPDRSRVVRNEGRTSSWNDFKTFARQHFAGLGQGQGLRFLSGAVTSPSLEALRTHMLAKWPQAKWLEYEPLASDAALEGAQMAFGQAVVPQYDFDKANVILSLDSDFLGLDSATILPIRQFSRHRRLASEKEEMNRLYVVESQFSVTGATADHRLPMRASDVQSFAAALAKELNVSGAELKIVGQPAQSKWIAVLAKDLNANRGKCLVVAGPRQPAAVHAMAHLLNAALGNAGVTVTYAKASSPQPQLAALKDLAGEMSRGSVSTLVVLGGNPVYTAPAELDFAANLKKVATTIHLGAEEDETGSLAKWHLPEAHFLETWGDARAIDGTLSVQQPMITPLHGGLSALEVAALISGYPDQRGYDIVRNLHTGKLPAANRDKMWRKVLHDGIVADSKVPPVSATVDVKGLAAKLAAITPKPASDLEVVFVPSTTTYDGRFANNAWLQETPDPMTKLVWDNAALMNYKTAKSLGVATGDVITLERAGRKIEAPVLIQPGQAEGSVTIALGYGRTQIGRIGRGVGVNAYMIRTSDAAGIATDVKATKTGRAYKLATTQDHHSMEGRPLVREASLEHYKHHPDFAEHAVHVPELFSLFEEHDYSKGYQWGMTIDLSSCIGCNACMVACQAENNIPVVGKSEVLRGREMHWIRLDRYFVSSKEYAGREAEDPNPQAVTQPIPCMQCENAPCESVCPVAATVHSPEGLNDMAYNRCVGTRYCANNCPYKVRRFNFLNYHKHEESPMNMVYNPEVTVRMRGIMEKCTYCVQRIQEKRILAKSENRRELKDGEVVTACQQTCPAEAIVFGNINDPNSRVAQLKKNNRNYALLAELNTKPRTSFLAKVRNPHPELA